MRRFIMFLLWLTMIIATLVIATIYHINPPASFSSMATWAPALLVFACACSFPLALRTRFPPQERRSVLIIAVLALVAAIATGILLVLEGRIWAVISSLSQLAMWLLFWVLHGEDATREGYILPPLRNPPPPHWRT